MSGDTSDTAELKPLTLLEKTRAATDGFVATIKDYIPSIPKVLLITGIMLGTSYLLGTNIAEPWDLLKAGQIEGFGGLVSKLAMTLGLGAAISGSVGAYQGLSAANAKRCEEMGRQMARGKDCGCKPAPAQQPQLQTEYEVPKGLPLDKPKNTGIFAG